MEAEKSVTLRSRIEDLNASAGADNKLLVILYKVGLSKNTLSNGLHISRWFLEHKDIIWL